MTDPNYIFPILGFNLLVTFCVGAYLLGSVPFGLLLTRMMGYGDIRKIGSGNIGATNVLRTGNKWLALATLIFDATKGILAALGLLLVFPLSQQCFPSEADCQISYYGVFAHYGLIFSLFGILGHMFPIWLKFKGGKGVATTLGALLAFVPVVGITACLTWLVMALVFRISSLSALVAIALTPIVAHFAYDSALISGICGIIALLVWVKHRANIQRLIKGEEPKIGKKKDK